jgi:cytochrome c5
MRQHKPTTILIALGTAVLLSACSDTPSTVTPLPNVTLSADQLAKYEASCKACHEVAGSGAPLTGDKEAWSKVLAQPIEDVMQKVVNGYQGMPPLGQCFDCNQEDLETLVYHMASAKAQKSN